MLRDLAAGFTDALGGRSSAYEDVLQRGRSEAINILTGHAERIGANAVVGLDIKYESVGGSMFLICASATAVRIGAKGYAFVVTKES